MFTEYKDPNVLIKNKSFPLIAKLFLNWFLIFVSSVGNDFNKLPSDLA